MVELLGEHIDYTSGILTSVRRHKILILCKKHGKQEVISALAEQEMHMYDLHLPGTEQKIMRDKVWLKKIQSC
jgi:galactokinase